MGGLRPGEAFGLKWSDVDLDGAKLHVHRSLTRRGVDQWMLVEPKTPRARRVVVLPEAAIGPLRAHRKQQIEERMLLGRHYQNHELVFATAAGTPLDLANLYHVYSKLLQRAELGRWEGDGRDRRFVKGFRLYDLRHTCATLLLLAEENPRW